MFSALVRLTPGIESAKSCDIINMFHNCPQAVIHPNETSDYFLAPTTCVFLEQTWRVKMRSIYLLTLPSQIEANPTKMRTRIFQASHFMNKMRARNLCMHNSSGSKAHVYCFGNSLESNFHPCASYNKAYQRGWLWEEYSFVDTSAQTRQLSTEWKMLTRRISTRFYVMRTRFCMFP